MRRQSRTEITARDNGAARTGETTIGTNTEINVNSVIYGPTLAQQQLQRQFVSNKDELK